jgi:hypothetical protein
VTEWEGGREEKREWMVWAERDTANAEIRVLQW